MKFTHALVKTPSKTFPSGLSAPNSEPASYDLAVRQHMNYIKALKTCGLEVILLEPDDAFPDSTFVEDAANCIWVNGTVLLPSGYPGTTRLIQAAGYPMIELEISEFRKMNGGLSCLSLRF